MSKPRIWMSSFQHYRWLCSVLTDPLTFIGVGSTPREAYDNWEKQWRST